MDGRHAHLTATPGRLILKSVLNQSPADRVFDALGDPTRRAVGAPARPPGRRAGRGTRAARGRAELMAAPVVHSTFSVERTYPAPAARVFAAFADPATKRRWLVDGPGVEVDEFTLDFRVGGFERTRFRVGGGP